ncbi:MAG: UDP-N-acetylmuramate dehydrogenase [Patescibacteria group bacterium]
MQIRAYKNLQRLHTFGVPWRSEVYCSLHTFEEAIKAIHYANEKHIDILVLGGGSNILPTKDWQGLVIKNEIGGRAVMEETKDTITIEIGSGENWHDLVFWSMEQGMYGLENLALIPGTVGGAVVQNIGAYDVDIARYIKAVEVIEIASEKSYWMNTSDCNFSYRKSIFKSQPGKWLITRVRLELLQKFTPVLSYKALEQALGGIAYPRAQDVAQRVIDIRQSKLPDWQKIGTAGSFFANPRVNDTELKQLQAKYPQIPVFHNYGTKEHTIPAGYLIEHCGLAKADKEKFIYPKHHLVLVNNAKNTDAISGREIDTFSKIIEQRVKDTFGITLMPEVVVL